MAPADTRREGQAGRRPPPSAPRRRDRSGPVVRRPRSWRQSVAAASYTICRLRMPYMGPLVDGVTRYRKTYRAVVYMSIKTQTCVATLPTAATCEYLA